MTAGRDDRLLALLDAGRADEAARWIALQCAKGTAAKDIAEQLAVALASRSGAWQGCVIALAGAVRASSELDASRSGLPLTQSAALTSGLTRPGGEPKADATADPNALIEALYEEPITRAQHAPLIDAVVELSEIIGSDVCAPLVSRVMQLLNAPPTAPNGTEQHAEHLALLEEQWERLHGAEDPGKADRFQEPKFRKHLLDGTPEAAFRATAKALAFGVPRVTLAGSLGLAAAERALRFDAEIALDRRRKEDWRDPLRSFEIAAAVTRLLRRSDSPRWAKLLLTAVWLVNGQQALDAKASRRFELPEAATIAQTWDHGPELAKIEARVLAGDGPGAIALLRGYLLMVLPVQPLCQQLRQIAFDDLGANDNAQLSAMTALLAGVEVFASLGDNPHREIVLGAAFRLATAPLGERRPRAKALEVIDALDGMFASELRASRLWT